MRVGKQKRLRRKRRLARRHGRWVAAFEAAIVDDGLDEGALFPRWLSVRPIPAD